MLRQSKEVRYLIAVLFHLVHYSKSIRTNDVFFFLSFFPPSLKTIYKNLNIFKIQMKQYGFNSITIEKQKNNKKQTNKQTKTSNTGRQISCKNRSFIEVEQ